MNPVNVLTGNCSKYDRLLEVFVRAEITRMSKSPCYVEYYLIQSQGSKWRHISHPESYYPGAGEEKHTFFALLQFPGLTVISWNSRWSKMLLCCLCKWKSNKKLSELFNLEQNKLFLHPQLKCIWDLLTLTWGLQSNWVNMEQLISSVALILAAAQTGHKPHTIGTVGTTVFTTLLLFSHHFRIASEYHRV